MAVSLGLLLLSGGCHTVVKQYQAVYTVDPSTVWETVELTPQGVHYGVDMAGMAKHDLFRTFWLQKRSANNPYLYEKMQVNLNCHDRQIMMLVRTLVQNNEVISINANGEALAWWTDENKDPPFIQWQPIKPDTLQDRLADKVCLAPNKPQQP